MKTTKPDTITERIKIGQRFAKRGLADRDSAHSKRFLDGSEAASLLYLGDDEGEGLLPQSQEVGNVNYLAINIHTKVASIAIGDPDFYLSAGDPDQAEMARVFMRSLWKNRRFSRVSQKALLKRSISGMGIVAYLWNAKLGPVIEHVRACDLAIDPNVVDWRNLRWAARRILMPREEAEERFPKQAVMFASQPENIPNVDEPGPLRKNAVELWTYWDETTEAIVHGSDVIESGENLYGKVPLLFLEGDIAPESEFSTGDYDQAIGLQVMLAKLQAIINNQAENGGAIGWVNDSLLADGAKEAFTKGRPQGFVSIQGEAQDTFGYVNGEPMTPALLEAFRIAQQGLDGATGVSEYQRGVLNQSVKFATEAALLANQSGSRGNQARIEYELFLDDIARAILDMLLKFGASMLDQTNPDEVELFQALSGVRDICVLESSTAYKDPAYEMTKATQMSQALLPFLQMGIIDPVKLAIIVIRAFGQRDPSALLTTQAKMSALPPQIPQGGIPASAPGGSPPPQQGGGAPIPPAGNAGVH